jgi:hypothetical protein
MGEVEITCKLMKKFYRQHLYKAISHLGFVGDKFNIQLFICDMFTNKVIINFKIRLVLLLEPPSIVNK